jgi:enoyl-CoA hydratase/carnithine racemase
MMNQPEEAVLFDVSDGVATITLNRPDQLNAINGALTKGLGAAVRQGPRT